MTKPGAHATIPDTQLAPHLDGGPTGLLSETPVEQTRVLETPVPGRATTARFPPPPPRGSGVTQPEVEALPDQTGDVTVEPVDAPTMPVTSAEVFAEAPTAAAVQSLPLAMASTPMILDDSASETEAQSSFLDTPNATDDATLIADETLIAPQQNYSAVNDVDVDPPPPPDAPTAAAEWADDPNSRTDRTNIPQITEPLPRIVKYELIEKIASGTFGSVWRACDVETGVEVAAKVMHDHAVNIDPEAARRFEREAKTLTQLAHPHIVDFLDVGLTSDGEPMLIMELVRGETLAKLHKGNKLELQDIFQIINQVLGALEHAHNQSPRVIHRDLKPSNILVDLHHSDRPYTKLIDFGVVKWLDSGAEKTSLTQHGSAIGTLLYMSPEQALGMPVDERSDLFSVGVILYELLVGFHPFRSREQKKSVPLELLDAIVHNPHHRIQDSRFLISRTLHQVIVRALRKRPDERYQDAESFRTELAEAADSL